MKVFYILFTFFLFNSIFPFTVIIDPGHGGKDPGAIKDGVKEKDINLKVAFFLKNIIEKKVKGVKVVLTRNKDIFLSLQERVEIANKYSDDEAIFISIHTNSHDKSNNAKGIEIYYFDNTSEKIIKERIGLIDQKLNYCYKDTIRNVLNKMVNSKLILDSKRLAASVADGIKNLPVNIRFIKPANFFVSSYVLNPSILIEIGFITEYDLKKDSYLYNISTGITIGILIYYKKSRFF